MGCEGPGRCCQAKESAQRWLPHREIRGERVKVAARRAKHAYHVAPTLLANRIRRPTMVPEDFLFTLCERRHRHCQVTGIGPEEEIDPVLLKEPYNVVLGSIHFTLVIVCNNLNRQRLRRPLLEMDPTLLIDVCNPELDAAQGLNTLETKFSAERNRHSYGDFFGNRRL